MKTSTVKPHFKWDGFREQYQGIIKNLINNIDICNEGFAKTGDEGYLAAREKYIEEVEELKTFIVKKELELGYYKKEPKDEK